MCAKHSSDNQVNQTDSCLTSPGIQQYPGPGICSNDTFALTRSGCGQVFACTLGLNKFAREHKWARSEMVRICFDFSIIEQIMGFHYWCLFLSTLKCPKLALFVSTLVNACFWALFRFSGEGPFPLYFDLTFKSPTLLFHYTPLSFSTVYCTLHQSNYFMSVTSLFTLPMNSRKRLSDLTRAEKQDESVMPFRLLDLPPKLRLKIYRFALVNEIPIDCYSPYRPAFLPNVIQPLTIQCGLLQASGQVHREASPILYGDNEFLVNDNGLDDTVDFIPFLKDIGTHNTSLVRKLIVVQSRWDHGHHKPPCTTMLRPLGLSVFRNLHRLTIVGRGGGIIPDLSRPDSHLDYSFDLLDDTLTLVLVTAAEILKIPYSCVVMSERCKHSSVHYEFVTPDSPVRRMIYRSPDLLAEAYLAEVTIRMEIPRITRLKPEVRSTRLVTQCRV